MKKSREVKNSFEQQSFYGEIISLLQKQSSEQKNFNFWIILLTVVSVVIAGLLFFVAYHQGGINEEISKSNTILANVTAEEYGYHKPEVTLVDSYFVDLYIYQINDTLATFSFLNLARVYNLDQSDDIALVKPKYAMKTVMPTFSKPVNVTTEFLALNSDEVVFTQTTVVKPKYAFSIEGSPFPIPVVPGKEPQKVPFFINIESTPFKKENSFELSPTIGSLEVYHPNGLLLQEINMHPFIISYTKGSNVATVKNDNKSVYKINVHFTENESTYRDFKDGIISQYLNGEVTMGASIL